MLIVGADLLVRGASRLAEAMGISPLVVGLTVVAFGTSAPELAVSVRSAYSGGGAEDIAIGNVLGSNICNILLILGVSAVIAPLVVSRNLVRRDVPIMIGATVLLYLLALDGRIGRVDGLILAGGAVAYTTLALRRGRREEKELRASGGPVPSRRGPLGITVDAAMTVIGLAMLVIGAGWFVSGAVSVARTLGVSELVVGLTVVALGTSLPELATSAMASIRGQRDIAVGNVVGSNLFNILLVLGVASAVSPQGIQVRATVIAFDLPVVLAATFACMPIFFTGFRISRLEGALFLCYYGLYLIFVALNALRHQALGEFTSAIVFFALPLTAVTFLVTSVHFWRKLKAPTPN